MYIVETSQPRSTEWEVQDEYKSFDDALLVANVISEFSPCQVRIVTETGRVVKDLS